ncbi:MAG TPA: NRDE family protein [Burkholderiaceae bacterium]|jgi:uncharacterized protein with NRDE domain|nr:NRDE family protein [Burkholderiaceae bacterium]
MCLILFAWQAHSEYPLIVAANRDEFYARRTRPASWWGQAVSLLAGRDEEAGGTWLGINRRGRFAVVTNVRAPNERNPHATSRGLLVLSALQTSQPMRGWVDDCMSRAHSFNGFNLLLAEPIGAGSRGAGSELVYLSNRLDDGARRLQAGVFGLSNAFLDTPWPKVTRGVTAFSCQIAQRVSTDNLLQLMADREVAGELELPSTGIPRDWERALSAIQIRANGYGTRATTVVTVRRDGLVTFVERSFDPSSPDIGSDRRFEFMIDGAAASPAGLGARTKGQHR